MHARTLAWGAPPIFTNSAWGAGQTSRLGISAQFHTFFTKVKRPFSLKERFQLIAEAVSKEESVEES